MLLTILILIALFIGVYTGIKRGVILQLIMTLGFVISVWVALTYYDSILYYIEMSIPYPAPLSTSYNPYVLYDSNLLFQMHNPFYAGLSFAIVFFIGWLITRFIGRLLDFVSKIKVIESLNTIGGAVISFFVHYVGVFFILFLLSTVSVDFIQEQFANSWLARTVVTQTPYLSESTYERFVVNTTELSANE